MWLDDPPLTLAAFPRKHTLRLVRYPQLLAGSLPNSAGLESAKISEVPYSHEVLAANGIIGSNMILV
jgi:hypothetical protein